MPTPPHARDVDRDLVKLANRLLHDGHLLGEQPRYNRGYVLEAIRMQEIDGAGIYAMHLWERLHTFLPRCTLVLRGTTCPTCGEVMPKHTVLCREWDAHTGDCTFRQDRVTCSCTGSTV